MHSVCTDMYLKAQKHCAIISGRIKRPVGFAEARPRRRKVGVCSMAERRMFSRNLVQTDRFLDLAPIAQALYFQLCLAADDDGFLSNVKSMARMVGAAPKDLTDLEAGGYLIRFPSGVAAARDIP